MNPEAPFLEAIKADPRDTATRLVYADWLEERGDPRAELIRIEEEMRPLPVFSDRFWQLKPRRNELLAGTRPVWLEAMGFNSCPPLFGRLPTDCKGWWRLIRVFTERWYSLPPLPDIGGGQNASADMERRLGRKLPWSVREWAAFTRDIRGIRVDGDPDARHALQGVFSMQDIPGQAALSLLHNEDFNYDYAVLHADLEADDPPIYRRHRYGSPYRLVGPTVSAFVLGCAMRPVRGPGGGFDTAPASSDVLAQLRRHFPVRFALTTEEDCEIFEKDDVLVQFNPNVNWDRGYLKVDVFKPMPAESIPRFLWDCQQGWGKSIKNDDGRGPDTNSHGMFPPPQQLF